MATTNQLQDPFYQDTQGKKLPGSLNTLTILTFIGSGIALLSSLWNLVNAKSGIESLEKLQDSGQLDKMPGFMKGMVGPEALEMARKVYENRIPILVITLVSLALCVYGALQMRQLKKQGYYLYLIGEILPYVGSLIFLGMASFTGVGLYAMAIPVLFIILYTTQLKYLH